MLLRCPALATLKASLATPRVAGIISRPVARTSAAPISQAAFWQRSHHVAMFRSERVVCSAAEPDVAEAAPSEAELPEVVKMDIRVGQILECEKHPDADSLYVEKIDVGEEEPRTIVSGLVKYVPLEQLQGRKVVVLCNLKARNMRGIKSHGMLLCASDAAHENVEPLSAPEGAVVGERVFFGEGNQDQPEPAKENQVQKKKVWEAVQPDLKTDDGKVANFKGLTMLTSAGPITADTLPGASIS